MNLTGKITTEDNKLIGSLILGGIKFFNLKNEHFGNWSPKVKKHNNFTFHDYFRQFRS